MSGLNVGILSLDELELEQKLTSGTEEEKKMARRVLPVIGHHHWLLVSILLGNAAACEALPVVLNVIFHQVISIILSVSFVLICGEIIPQAVMTGPDQLKIASGLVPLVRAMMYLFSPISYPVAKLLDKVLGIAPSTTNFTSEDLRKLLVLHQNSYETSHSSSDRGLNSAQLQVIKGTMDLSKLKVSEFMVPIDKVFAVSDDLVMDDDALRLIKARNFSRVPVFSGVVPSNSYAVLLTKKLIGYNPPTPCKISDGDFKLRRPLYVLPSLSMLTLLQRFQEGTNHMAFVTPPAAACSPHALILNGAAPENMSFDEEKQIGLTVIGIITLEDVLKKLLDTNDATDRLMSQGTQCTVEPSRLSRRVMAGKTPIVRHVRLDSYYRIEDP